MAIKTTTQKVKEVINTNPGKTKKELAGILGIKHKTFIYHYQKLLKNGEVEKIDDVTSITSKEIENLEYYFTHGFTDEEACLQVNVSPSSFYLYCRNNPEWAERRQILKKKQVMKAKLLVSKNLEQEKDEYIKMVYQEDKRQERARLKVDLGVTKEDEEDLNIKNVSLKVTILD
jgi:predicted HTH transcriptional regulator